MWHLHRLPATPTLTRLGLPRQSKRVLSLLTQPSSYPTTSTPLLPSRIHPPYRKPGCSLPWSSPLSLHPYLVQQSRSFASSYDPLVDRLRAALAEGSGQDVWLAYISVRNAQLLSQLAPLDFNLVAQSQLSLVPSGQPSEQPGSEASTRNLPEEASPEADGEGASNNNNNLAASTEDASKINAVLQPPSPLVTDLISPSLRARIRSLCRDWLVESGLPWAQPRLSSSEDGSMAPDASSLTASKSTHPIKQSDIEGHEAEIYQPILKVYASIGEADEAHHLVQSVAVHGLAVSVDDVGQTIRAYRSAGNLQGAVDFFLEAVNSWSVKPTPDTIAQILDIALDRRDLEALQATYYTLSGQGYSPSAGYMGILAQAAARARNRSFVDQLFADLQARSPNYSDEVGSAFIAAFGQLRDADQVGAIFDVLQRRDPAKVSGDLYGIVINAFTECRRFDQVDRVYAALSSSGVVPGVFVNNNLMKAAFARGDLKTAMGIYHELAAKALQPDQYPAFQLPTPHTYSIVISGLCQGGQVKEADAILTEMMESGQAPMRHMVNQVMGRHLREKHYAQVIHWFQRMVDAGIEVNNYTAHIVMSAYINSGDAEEAAKLFQIFVDGGLQPNIYTYTTALRAFTKVGYMGRALALFEEMIGVRVYPNLYSYTTMIKGYALEGDVKGIRLMHRLFNLDLHNEPSSVLYNALMDAYNLVEEPLDAFQMWSLMRLNDMPVTNATVSIAIDTCGFTGYMIYIPGVLQRAAEQGLVLNANNFTSLLEAYFRQGALTNAIDVLLIDMVEMKRTVAPDAKFMATLLRFLASFGRLKAELPRLDACIKEHFPQMLPRWEHLREAQLVAPPPEPAVDPTMDPNSRSYNPLKML
ncbi:hypothetical protein H4R33_005851 [Dimargaris cristalligena]|nr:hypothetical protein H4R33_005851 [Dimargaris cristalligena]